MTNDHLCNAIIAVLRGYKRCPPVYVGNVQVYHFWRHQPHTNRINVPWIKDLRPKQFAMSGYLTDYLQQAQQYLYRDRILFAPVNAFIAPTETFADEVIRWYGGEKPWYHFANYPDRRTLPEEKRDEIVYIDYASTVFQPQLFSRIIGFFDELHVLTGINGVIVTTDTMLPHLLELPRRDYITVTTTARYDYQSKFGMLCNFTNFQQAAECLPRKLLVYLHCGMIPLIHSTFTESILYCRRYAVPYGTWYTVTDTIDHISSTWWDYDRQQFCMQERIGDLVAILRRMGGIT